MTITRSGTSQKYTDNWATAFGGGKKKVAVKVAKKEPKAAKKKVKKKNK